MVYDVNELFTSHTSFTVQPWMFLRLYQSLVCLLSLMMMMMVILVLLCLFSLGFLCCCVMHGCCLGFLCREEDEEETPVTDSASDDDDDDDNLSMRRYFSAESACAGSQSQTSCARQIHILTCDLCWGRVRWLPTPFRSPKRLITNHWYT